jgi:hypothetical protein
VAVDPGHLLHGIACPSSTLCVAVDDDGRVVTSTNPTGGPAEWSAASIGEPFPGSTLGVACTSVSLCMVVGMGGLVYSTNPTAGASAWTKTDALAGYTGFFMITCANPTLCLASDGGQSRGLHQPHGR